MAIIVEKYPFIGNTGQCLILDVRERLIYPFNFQDYQQIRFGMFYSFTSGSNGNTYTNTNTNLSTSLYSVNAINNQMYLGFCNFNTGSYLPGSTNGYDYVGVYQGGGANAGPTVVGGGLEYMGGIGGASRNMYAATMDATGRIISLNAASNSDFYVKSPSAPTGATSYAGFWGMRFIYNPNGTFSFRGMSNGTTYASDVSTTALRTNLSSLGVETFTTYTGCFTSGGSINDPLMMKPNALILYVPTFGNRLRIHNLAIEKYE